MFVPPHSKRLPWWILVELPELCEGVLDPPTLQRLVADLEGLTEIQDVILKGGEFTMAERSAMSLGDAVELLWAGGTRGVQVRYGWKGECWTDTMLRLPNGVRLVRMKAPVAP